MMLNSDDLSVLCQIAKKAAIESGTYIQSQTESHYAKKSKIDGGSSLASQVVTAVDLLAEKIIISHLQETIAKYDLGLLTEESSDDHSRKNKDYFWCVDPMDGTLAFTEGRSGYAVSIALVSLNGDPLIGVVYLPDHNDLYAAIKGEGIWLNGKPFTRKFATVDDEKIHWYMDRSLQTDQNYKIITSKLVEWCSKNELSEIEYHSNYGAVCNAIGVMQSNTACYFKFPKRSKGGGSIWDYAATRLFFEELGIPVSDALGNTLNLNLPETTFMNQKGIIYTTSSELSKWVIKIGAHIQHH